MNANAPAPMIDYALFDRIRPIRWTGTALELLDQRKLPFVVEYLSCDNSAAVAQAIATLTVRGAPAIGIAAAWGVVLAAREIAEQSQTGNTALLALKPAMERLRTARPTAVNLAWALDRMQQVLIKADTNWLQRLIDEAKAIADEDLAANRKMGELGAASIEPGSGVLTHCNTGSLACAGFGTALGVIRAGYAQQRIQRVFATETRPWLQGARLTVWELQQDGIAATLIADSAAAHLMKTGAVQWVIVGADRICANGDTANKIGTYALALAAQAHGVKLMVVAASSTVDMNTPHGQIIEIEQRDAEELRSLAGVRTVAEGINTWNPVFDVTEHPLIDAIVTECGVILNPNAQQMRTLFSS